MLNEQDQREVEKAIGVMVSALERENRKDKPVIIHSARVGLYVYNQDYAKDTVIAAFLHDVVEASDVSFEDIGSQFGREVEELVRATTRDESIKDPTARYRDMYERCLKKGRDALVIKAADLLDNMIHVYRGETDPGKRKQDFEKVKYFLNFTRQALSGERVWDDLSEAYISTDNYS